MKTPPASVLLLTAIGLLASPRAHAGLPPGPDVAPTSVPATAPPLTEPLSPEPPKQDPAPPPAGTPAAPAKPSPPPARPAAAPAPAPNPAPAPAAPVQKVAAGGILGRTVVGPDGQAIGRVVDVLVDAASNPRAAVIDFGGFMGVGSRRIAVNWSDLNFPPVNTAGAAANIKLDLSTEQIMNAPQYTDQDKPAAVVEPPAAPGPGH